MSILTSASEIVRGAIASVGRSRAVRSNQLAAWQTYDRKRLILSRAMGGKELSVLLHANGAETVEQRALSRCLTMG
jgi:hypothetical protein